MEMTDPCSNDRPIDHSPGIRQLTVQEAAMVSGAGTVSEVLVSGALGTIGGAAAGRIAGLAFGAAIGGPVGAAIGFAIGVGFGFATGSGGGGRYRIGPKVR